MAEELFYAEFTRHIQTLLVTGQTGEALSIFQDPSNISEIEKNSWDLIPVVARFLNGNARPELFDCCKKLIDILCDVSNPEEALLQFIEELEETEDDVKFFTLLTPLHKIIIRVPKNRLNSLAWCFNSIHTFLNKSEIPSNEDFVNKEKICVEENAQILDRYEKLFVFNQELVQTVKESMNQCWVLRKYLIQLLGRPIVYLSMEVVDDVKTRGRVVVEKLCYQIITLLSDPIALLQIPVDENAELFKPDDVGLAVLFYLIYSEGILVEFIPKVYSPFYFFHNSLHLSVTLLSIDHQIVINKGLHLANALLLHVKYHKLSYLMLGSEDHPKFCKAVMKIIIYNENEYIRKFALNTYKNYLLSFEAKGFYLLIYNIISITNHAGLIGFTIDLFKGVLVEEISKNQNISPYFTHDKLLNLLQMFCRLPQKEETDLIDISDQVTASLNLLRYLVLRDEKNVTGVWNYVSLLDESFFKPLRTAIDISRTHYNLRVKEVTEGTVPVNEQQISVSVGKDNLPSVSKQEQLNVLYSSLTAFDIIESLLIRLLECIEANKK